MPRWPARAICCPSSCPPPEWVRAAKAMPQRVADTVANLQPVLARIDDDPVVRAVIRDFIEIADALHDQPRGRSEAWWREAVRREERRGEPLAAVDVAQRALADYPDSTWLRHRAVLALARAGATARAARFYHELGLADSEDAEIRSLGARIAKDVALAAHGRERLARALDARDRYAAIHARRPDYYPAVNAATLSLLCGDIASAEALAREALVLAEAASPATYYSIATVAEAQLVLDQPAAAAVAIAAARRHGDDFAALATTRRQLRLVCELRGIAPAILKPLAGPRVAHYCGHRIAPPGQPGRFPAHDEPVVAAAIRAELAQRPVGVAYGGLAGGADILWAEALLAAGAQLHVVLPFERDAFVAASVARSGPSWAARFDACLAAATSVVQVFDGVRPGDDALFGFGAQHAMGLALLRSQQLGSDAVQLAVWDGGPALGAAGTALDVQAWRQTGCETVIVNPWAGAEPAAGEAAVRMPRASVVVDVDGLARLSVEERERVESRIAAALADVLDAHADLIVQREIDGMALRLKLGSVVDAAHVAVALQQRIAALELPAIMSPGWLNVAVSAYIDPLSPEAGDKAALPNGEVYVSEHFAAAVQLTGRGRFACEFVGHLPRASGPGRVRMHRLRASQRA